MPYRTDIVYSYDGSFEGLLCCVFESYSLKELPLCICSEEAEQTLLFPIRQVETDPEKARRVRQSIPAKICPEALEQAWLAWLTCAPNKDLLVLRFLRLGFARGKAVMDMLADETVHQLHQAVRHLQRESHQYTGFVRFSVYDGVMVAVIEPKNQVLPLIQEHFCDRFKNQVFMIYDATHQKALIHRPGRWGIIPLDELTLPEVEAEEAEYRRLWKRFYDSIAIEGRVNPRLRMSHMPKRHWNRLPELQASEAYPVPAKESGSKAAEAPALPYTTTAVPPAENSSSAFFKIDSRAAHTAPEENEKA